MKRYLNCTVFLISILGCQNNYKSIKDRELNLIKNKAVYDSVQVFVDSNIATNLRSEIYLLQFIGKRSDSLDYILTTIHPKAILKKYKDDPYVYNKDSSLLIIDGDYTLVDKKSKGLKRLSELGRLQFSNDTGKIIFNPLIWKITIIQESILLDRLYGRNEVEKDIVIPKDKFK